MTANEETRIYMLRMDRGPNVVNSEFVNVLSRAIEKVERAKHSKALVLTGNREFFSNGLDRFRGAVVWLPNHDYELDIITALDRMIRHIPLKESLLFLLCFALYRRFLEPSRS